jgi:peroxisomal coenzyme A diphosphatase NUDT7
MEITDIVNAVNEHTSGIIGRHRCFSVVIPLVDVDGELHILYEVRSSKIKRQPGEICFPGGEKEPGETDIECAVRETSEELCIDKDDISVIGEVGTMFTYGGYVIKAYAAQIDRETIDNASPSESEVSELFTVPLEFFVNNEPEVYYSYAKQEIQEDFPLELIGFPGGYKWASAKTEVPIYVYDKYVIWGITGRITRYFANMLKNSR